MIPRRGWKKCGRGGTSRLGPEGRPRRLREKETDWREVENVQVEEEVAIEGVVERDCAGAKRERERERRNEMPFRSGRRER